MNRSRWCPLCHGAKSPGEDLCIGCGVTQKNKERGTEVTVHWTAFGGHAHKSITVDTYFREGEALLEDLYASTNLYAGVLWDLLQPLPENRTHTALSVGDRIDLDGVTYEVASFGFNRVQHGESVIQ